MKSPKLYKVIKLTLSYIVNNNYDITLTDKEAEFYLINQQDNAIFTHIRRITNDYSDFNKYVIFVDCKNGKNKKKIMMKLLTQGFFINSNKYLISDKSASMSRQGMLMYIQESIFNKLDEIITMGIKIDETVLSKYLSYRGLFLSSSFDLPNYKPKVVVVDDYEKIIKNQKIKYSYDKEKSFIIQDINTNDKLHKFLLTYLKYEQVERIFSFLENPLKDFKENNIDKILSIKQIDKKKLSIAIEKFNDNQKNIGKEVKYKEKAMKEDIRDVSITPFDGVGIIKPSNVDYIKQELNIEERPSAMIIRAPYIKGMVFEVDFITFFEERNIYQIKDIWGKYHSIYDIDLILTKSQYKGYNYFKDKNTYEDFEQYWKMFEKYHHTFRIAKWNYSFEQEPVVSKANYQILQTRELKSEDFLTLADYSKRHIERIISGNDIVSTMCFLGMKDNKFKPSNTYMKAILKNNEMIKDPMVKKYLYKILQKNIDKFKIGRIYLDGSFQILSCDPIALLEYIGGLEVKGVLEDGEIFSRNVYGTKVGDYSLYRNPHLTRSEGRRVLGVSHPLLEKLVGHISNVCFLNHKSLILASLNGADL